MRNIRITLAYRGTAYHGWQVQQNARSVCAAFQDGVEVVLGRRYDVKGCSRTDAGVHAGGFVLSVLCPEEDAPGIPCGALQKALNNVLPRDMAVLSCADAPAEFHPRYDCVAKRYLYRVWNSPVKNPFLEDLALQYRYLIREELAAEAARQFLGEHDFTSLCAAGGSVLDKTRTIYRCGVKRQGELVTLWVTGNGFLYNMVRILAGTVLEVCAGRLCPEEIPGILAAKDRSRAGPTLPPYGLYLDRVFYPGDNFMENPTEEILIV